MRFDNRVLQAAPFEDTAVRLVMLVVREVEARLVHVEGIRVLHDELPDTQQTGFRTRLVTELSLDLVPDLRQLLIAAKLAPRNYGHHLLVGHTEAKVALET